MSENENHQGPGDHSGSPSADGQKDRRLPPPAFPPGKRRIHVRRHLEQTDDELGEAYISPDAPLPARGPGLDAAIISPDDPMPERTASQVVATAAGALDAEEGVVTSMGLDAHLDPEELAAAGDPHVMELVAMVGVLAEALKRRGEAGLRSLPGMSRFEATLRAYCVGYLAGRRAEQDEPEYPEY